MQFLDSFDASRKIEHPYLEHRNHHHKTPPSESSSTPTIIKSSSCTRKTEFCEFYAKNAQSAIKKGQIQAQTAIRGKINCISTRVSSQKLHEKALTFILTSSQSRWGTKRDTRTGSPKPKVKLQRHRDRSKCTCQEHQMHFSRTQNALNLRYHILTQNATIRCKVCK